MRVSRNFKLGILVVLTFLFFFIGFNFLKSFGTFGKVREFTVEFPVSGGLQVNDDVQLHGVNVGKVKSIDLHPNDASRVLVHFSVEDDDLELPVETQVWLISSDILGTKALDLRIPHDTLLDYPELFHEDGDTFDIRFVNIGMSMEEELEAQFLPIKTKTEELISRVEDIIFKVSAYWDNSGAYAFDASMYDVRDAVNRYNEMTLNLTELVQVETRQVGRISTDIKNFQEFMLKDSIRILEISNCFADVSRKIGEAELRKSFTETGEVFMNLDEKFRWVSKGNGTVGFLMNKDSISQEIAKIDTAFKSLKWHLEERPKDFFDFSIFGLKAKGYKPDKDKKPYLDATLDSLEDGKEIDYK